MKIFAAFRAFLVGILLVPIVANAAFPTSPTTEYGGPPWNESMVAACQQYVATLVPPSGGSYTYDSIVAAQRFCLWDYTAPNGTTTNQFGGVQMGTRVVQSCPSNSTLEGGACSCNSGFNQNSSGDSCIPEPPPPCPPPMVRVNGQCVPPCPPPTVRQPDGTCKNPKCEIAMGSAVPGTNGQFTSPGYQGGMMCMSGCLSYPDFAGKSPSGTWFATGPFTSSGVYCSGTGSGSGGPPSPLPPSTNPPDGPPGETPPADPDKDPPNPEPPPQPCGKGLCPGTVNGQSVCMPCSDPVSNPPPTTTGGTSPPSGTPGAVTGGSGTGGSGTGGTPGGSGTSTTGTQTVCKGKTCTTTSTTKNPDGTTTTGQTSEDVDQFCTRNPRSPICIESSYSGNCEAPPTCTGDAVQCAQVKLLQEQKCALEKIPDGVQAAFDDLKSDSWLADLHITGPALTPPTAVTGQCALSDFQVSMIFGQSWSVPLSRFCVYMDAIRAMIGVLGALAFAVIVFKN